MPTTISGTTGIQVPLGSVGAPAISNTTDSTTGLYFPASNTVGIAVAGAIGLYVSSSGQIGVKTATPAYPLDVNGTANFPGTTSAIGAILTDVAEVTTVSATAATGTINFDVTTQSVLYYTSNASANWTVNIRGNSSTSLNTILATNQTLTIAHMVTQGATAYYNSAVTIDGASVTPKWQNGVTPSSGNTSSVDVYTYTVVKTASATFTVFASQTKFA